MPNIFPAGKSYILIKGSDYLQNLSDIDLEIIDSDGYSVFYSISNSTISNNRIISVWVQHDTAVGNATLTFIGKLNDVPDDWKNKYNVKYSCTIYLDKNIQNDLPINFDITPVVNAREYIRNYVNYNNTKLSNSEFTSGTITGINLSSLSTLYSNEFTDEVQNVHYEISINGLTKLTQSLLNPIIYIDQITGYYKINEKIKYTTIYNYTSSISSIKNSSVFNVTTPPTTSDGYILNFDYITPYKITYNNLDTGSSTIFTASYTELNIDNISPIYGEVKTLRVYKNMLNSEITKQHIGDYSIQNYEILNTDNNIKIVNIGDFKDTNSLIYWTTSSIYTSSYFSSSVKLDDSLLFGAVKLYTNPIDNPLEFYPNDTYISRKGYEYSLSINCATTLDYRLIDNAWNENHGLYNVGDIVYVNNISYVCTYTHNPNPWNETEPGIGGDWQIFWQIINNITTLTPVSEIEIYISGSGVLSTNTYGKLIGTISTQTNKNYGNILFNFLSDYDGEITPIFVIKTGNWFIADISLKHASDFGFNPISTKIYIPNTSIKRNDFSMYEIQFLNCNNDISEVKTYTDLIKIVNNPVYIELDDNILTGSMYIGTEKNSGIEMSGKSSGYVKSIGYSGYSSATLSTTPPGFIIYSGSKNLALALGSSDDYEGVGLELNAGNNYGRMRFKANYTNSMFEVIADSFFVGDLNIQYISGSGGIIEISSSNFLLSSSGNVYIDGEVNAKTGSFGGFTIDSSSINSSYLFISGSPTNELGYNSTANMFISTSNYNIKSNGDITGSSVLFMGGKIAGLNLGDYNLTSGYINITASLSQTDPASLTSNHVFNNMYNFVVLSQSVVASGSKVETINGTDYLRLHIADGSDQNSESAEASGSVLGGLSYTINFNMFLSGSESGSIITNPFPLNIGIYENNILMKVETIIFTTSENGGIQIIPSTKLITYTAQTDSILKIRLELGNVIQQMINAFVYISDFTITYFEPKVEISERGILIATSPYKYVKLNVDSNTFTNLNANTLNTNNILNGSGSHNLYINTYLSSDYIYLGFDNNLRLFGTGSGFTTNINQGKLTFGTFNDVNLYRYSSNILKTDDSFHIGADTIVSQSLILTGSLYMKSAICTYNGITTYGQGVSPIIYAISELGATSGININVTTNTGFYKINVYYSVNSLDVEGGSIYSTITYYNPSATSHTLTGTTLIGGGGNIGEYYSYSYNVYHVGTNNLNITLTTVGLGGADNMNYAVSVERLI